MAENSIRDIKRCVYSADGGKTYCGMDRGGHLYADHFFRQAQSESEFDKTFRELEGPNHPATCDNCGKEGTNSSLENHPCANEFEGVDMAENDAPERIWAFKRADGGRSWHNKRLELSDVEYVRADLAPDAPATDALGEILEFPRTSDADTFAVARVQLAKLKATISADAVRQARLGEEWCSIIDQAIVERDWNITFTLSRRAVVLQISHTDDHDAEWDVDKSFPSLPRALEAAANECETAALRAEGEKGEGK